MSRKIGTEAWEILEQVRGPGFRDPEDIVALLQREQIYLSPSELPAFGRLLSRGDRRHFPVQSIPDWLVTVFSVLAKGRPADRICDPFAGIGLLIGPVLEATKAKTAIAFTPTRSEAALGAVLVENAEWQIGMPLELLASLKDELDLVTSILLFGSRMSRDLPVGSDLPVDVGRQVVISASERLSADGIALFVVAPSFFFRIRSSVFEDLAALGLGVYAVLALPPGTFAPGTNIPSYLVVVRKTRVSRMFVAQLSSDGNTNEQALSNLVNGEEGESLELGRFVEPLSFRGLDGIRAKERFEHAERQFGAPAVTLRELAIDIRLGRYGDDYQFPKHENAVFVPLIGLSDVVASIDDIRLKPQNYAQVAIDPARSEALFVARFLNSELGKEMRELHKTGTVIPKLNKQTLKELPVFVPDLVTQIEMMLIESRITAEENTLLGLHNELGEFRRNLWISPLSAADVDQRLSLFSRRLSTSLKQHAVAGLDQWFETLPFPLASILRAWQATPSQDFATKYQHLLHFFEATAEFWSLILLSAFSSNQALFESHRARLAESMRKQHLSFQRATFGTWKLVVEYWSKQTRDLLSGDTNARALGAELFADPTKKLAEALSRVEITSVLGATNKMRNDWIHGGVVGQEEAQLRNEQLLQEVQRLREAMADTWNETQLIQALHCVPRRGIFENEVAILMGSNSEFLKETRPMAMWLDVERLYLYTKGSGRALELVPLVQIGPSPLSANNACYFYSRADKDSLRFVSYHFIDQPERSIRIDSDMSVTLKSLWADDLA